MFTTVVMVLTYIACCVWIRTPPWKYFQINAHYFSEEAGIFSKLSLDRLIPGRWRLSQGLDTGAVAPARFPVFLKPEWGQNAHGIHRADDAFELRCLRARLSAEPQRYILQEAAPGAREFEIFGIDVDRHDRHHDVLTVTEAVNGRERFPINSKYNDHTRYVDVTDQFDDAERQRLGAYLTEMGRFGITRVSVRADTREALLEGRFHVIEINLFLPMPINLLDVRYTVAERWRFIRRAMMALARSTKLIDPVAREKAIFTRMMFYGGKRPTALAEWLEGARDRLFGTRYAGVTGIDRLPPTDRPAPPTARAADRPRRRRARSTARDVTRARKRVPESTDA